MRASSQWKGLHQDGVCGKDPEVSALQDLLIYTLKGLSLYAVQEEKSVLWTRT